MTTVFRARISAQQHQGGPRWPPLEHQSSLQRTIRAQTHHLTPTSSLRAEHESAAAAKGHKNATTPISSLCCIPPSRMATHRRGDLEVIWPAPPKPSTPGAARGRRSVLASLRLHVSSQLRVHIGAPRLPLTPPTCVWCRAVIGDAAAPSCGGFALFLLSGGQKRDRDFPLLAEGGTAAPTEVHDGKSPALIQLYLDDDY